ncbi:response regulator, partial [Bacteroides caecigallinarum]|uniref:response regulator n=1 Tax=Bacteroides caecigallinarum TaxID=1411144 RepID=UPI00293EF421
MKVSDTGYGISEEALPFVFDRYYQEKGSHQASGTGIGLALVKKLIDLHHARISIESKVNEGTEFRILLSADYTYPDDLHNDDSAVCLENEDLEAVNTSGQSVNGEKPILLVVEDNEDIKNYVADSLSDVYDVRTADNGKMGLQIALDVVPDVIVTDIMMPEMDGIEVCKTIKNNMCTSHIPVILLTAKNSLHDKEEGYMAGADSYITKPFSASLLKTRIGNILETRKRISEKISSEYSVKEKRKLISESTTKLDNDFLQKFNSIVEANLSSDKVDVGYIADKLCMSNSTLYRKVKALTGLSTNEYIRKIKMQHAEQLLLEGKYNISE